MSAKPTPRPLRMPELTIPQALIYDELLAEMGPLYEPVDTEWTVLECQAVMAMVERAP